MDSDSRRTGLAASTTADLGVLGTGRMGVRLAAMFARAGRRVVLGSRDPERAERIARALALPGLAGGSYDDAVAARAVLPAIFLRDGLAEVIAPYAARLAGKLVIDISNPFNQDYSDYILPWDSSGSEVLQQRLPEARLVGAYKHVFAAVFDDPAFEHGSSDVLIVGDDAAAKSEFLALAHGTPFRYLDAGPLIHARTVERLTLITSRVGRGAGYHPRMNWRLDGEAGWTGSAETERIERLLAS